METALSEVNVQTKSLQHAGIIVPKPKQGWRQDEVDDPEWCEATDTAQLPGKDLFAVIKSKPFVHLLVAGLFDFVGDTEGAVRIASMAEATQAFGHDLNVNGNLAQALYLEGDELTTAIKLLNAELDDVDRSDKSVTNFIRNAGSKIALEDKQISEKLRERYVRARVSIKLRRAYYFAHLKLRSLEDPSLEYDGLAWATARRDAEDAYRAYPSVEKWPLFVCVDDSREFFVEDSYGYVEVAFAAYDLQKTGISPNLDRVREARRLVQDAMALVTKARNDLRDPSAKSSCLEDPELKAWTTRLSSHLKLAEALLRR